MCQSVLAVATVLILVGSPPGRASQSFSDAQTRNLVSQGTVTGLASELIGGILLPLPDDSGNYALSSADSTEEQQGYSYNSYYAPSTVNFHDIYSNSLAMLAEDPVLTTLRDDDSYHLSNLPTQFVEFHPQTQTVPPPPSTNSPAPMYLLKSSMLKNETEDTTTTSTTTSTSTTTEEPEEIAVKVIPIKKSNYQRGVLDLLFPAARVRTFKSVFDTFRRLMSHTFR